MAQRNISAPEHHYVSSDQLRTGLHIHLDLPWFDHPFTLNSFKISSDEQLRTLRGLNVPRFRYDPKLSDTRPDGPDTHPEPGADPAGNGPTSANRPECSTQDVNPRVRQFQKYRQSVARAEKAFIKAAAVMQRLNKDLLVCPGETLEELGGLVDQMVTLFLERPEVTLQVVGENCGSDEVYCHGLNVSILCLMLAKGLGFSHEQARLLGAGALLHDVGLMDIPAGIRKKPPEEYTKPERELRAMHVEYGVRIGRQVRVHPEILTIIAQHHEFADGSGYPAALTIEQIAPLARLVSLVNFYDNLCNPIDPLQAMTPHEALSFMYSRRRTKFDARALLLMIRSLGVYPPGSIVTLSDDSVAMVVSVNPSRPLRPCVRLYEPDIPREEARMLNLEDEPGMSIAHAMRPTLLPAAIRAYLSPSQRIIYFFDAEPLRGREPR